MSMLHVGSENRLRGISGLGALGAGLSPGSTCYDATHDPGEVHCASASDVILSAINPFTAGETTTCSDQETACLAANPGAATSGGDICSQYLNIGCPTLLGVGVGIFALVMIMGALKK